MSHSSLQEPRSEFHAEKAPGHWVLARLGKKVLRPGGLELTRRLLDSLAISTSDHVVEFAPGLGITAKMTIARTPRSYIAIERDEAAARIVRQRLFATAYACRVGRAEQTGLPAGAATVAYGEAMLTMQTAQAKARIVEEAARLLAPGGRYGIHEIALQPDSMDDAHKDDIRREMTAAVHHSVMPLSLSEWRALLEASGFRVQAVHTAPMHLLEPRRLVADEGLAGAIRFGWNLARDSASRARVLGMRAVFRKYADQLCAVAIVGVKDA